MTGQDYPATQQYRYQRWDATTTLAFWTPLLKDISGSTQVTITGLNISSNLGGTFQIYYGTTTTNPSFIGEYFVKSSFTISPQLNSIFGTIRGGIFYGRPSVSGTNGWTIMATGYET